MPARRVDQHLPLSDPSWAERSRPVLAFIEKPRTWQDLRRSRIGKMGFLRNALAWLEASGEAESLFQDGTVYWVKKR